MIIETCRALSYLILPSFRPFSISFLLKISAEKKNERVEKEK